MVDRWFHPSKIRSGWSKDAPQKERRRKVLHAHKGNALSTARSLQALANVTTDRETKRQAHKDAQYFYRKHKQ